MKYRSDRPEYYTYLELNVPHTMYQALRVIAHRRQMPLSRLVGYALDRALTNPELLTMDLETSQEEAALGQHAGIATKLFDFLSTTYGMGIDSMMLLRTTIGLTKREINLALEELKNSNRVEAYKPRGKYVTYHEDYRCYRVVRGKQPRVKVNHNRYEKKKVKGPLNDITED